MMDNKGPLPGECLNCGETVCQNYCPNCGQEVTPPIVPLRHLLQDVADEFLKLDSKFFHTVYPLLTRPGFLTNEYIAGRRVRYISPFRLYFLISALYFLAFSFAHYDIAVMQGLAYGLEQAHHAYAMGGASLKTMARAHGMNGMPGMLPAHSHAAHSDVHALHHEVGLPHPADESQATPNATPAQKLRHGNHVPPPADSAMHAHGGATGGELDRPQRHLRAVTRTSKWFLMNQSLITFLLVPIAALLLKLLYFRTGKLYIEHLVFAVNVQSFMFAILLPALLPYARSMTYLLAFGVSAVYLYLAMRAVYRQNASATLARCGVMLASYAAIMAAVAYIAFLVFYARP